MWLSVASSVWAQSLGLFSIKVNIELRIRIICAEAPSDFNLRPSSSITDYLTCPISDVCLRSLFYLHNPRWCIQTLREWRAHLWTMRWFVPLFLFSHIQPPKFWCPLAVCDFSVNSCYDQGRRDRIGLDATKWFHSYCHSVVIAIAISIGYFQGNLILVVYTIYTKTKNCLPLLYSICSDPIIFWLSTVCFLIADPIAFPSYSFTIQNIWSVWSKIINWKKLNLWSVQWWMLKGTFFQGLF